MLEHIKNFCLHSMEFSINNWTFICLISFIIFAFSHFLNDNDDETMSIYDVRQIYNKFEYYRINGPSEMSVSYAEELCKAIGELPDSTFDHNKLEIADMLNHVPDCLENNGNYISALNVGRSIYEIYLFSYGIKDRRTLLAQYNLSRYHSDINEWDNAISACTEILSLTKDSIDVYGDLFSAASNRLSEYYWGKDNEKSLQFAILSYKVRKQFYGEKHMFTIASLYNIGVSCFLMGNAEEGIIKMKEALEIISIHKEDMPNFYITSLSGLGEAYLGVGMYLEAIEKMKESVYYQEQNFGFDNMNISVRLRALIAECYMKLNDEEKAYQMAFEATEGYMKYVNKLSLMDSRDRYLSLNTGYIQEWFDIVLPQLTHNYKENLEFANLLFTSSMFRKNLLIDMERYSKDHDLEDGERYDVYNELNSEIDYF
ncbi:MAG: tetratricopeptide repeat protein [Bacteroidaceae bacterium]|nr:tetratricopeptide repeat protein [Bacteroidaceae bacterium]